MSCWHSCHHQHHLKYLSSSLCFLQLPYFRWKRFAVVAALCILAVRAVIVQLAFFLHIQASILPELWKHNGIFVENNGFAYSSFILLLTNCNIWFVLPFLVLITNSMYMQIDQTFVFRRPAAFSKPLIFATGFMTFFSVVIALFKVTAAIYLKCCSLLHQAIGSNYFCSL